MIVNNSILIQFSKMWFNVTYSRTVDSRIRWLASLTLEVFAHSFTFSLEVFARSKLENSRTVGPKVAIGLTE
jgi:hypothetical protein